MSPEVFMALTIKTSFKCRKPLSGLLERTLKDMIRHSSKEDKPIREWMAEAAKCGVGLPKWLVEDLSILSALVEKEGVEVGSAKAFGYFEEKTQAFKHGRRLLTAPV